GFGGRIGAYGALLHVINHGVTKALVFFVAGDLIGRYDSRDMRSIKGLLVAAPWVGTFLLLRALLLAGTPPLSIFGSELMVLRAGTGSGRFVSVAVFLAMVVIIFAGLIHHAGKMAFGSPSTTELHPRRTQSPTAAMLLLAAAMVMLGIFIPPEL